MKIAFVSTLYEAGGAERSARELFTELRARGHDVRMFVARLTGGEPDGVVPVRLRGERALRLIEKAGFWADWRHIGSRRALRRIRPDHCDVVHLHNLHGGWMSVAAVADLCRRLPCVWTLHDEWGPTACLSYDLGRTLGRDRLMQWFPEVHPLLDGQSPRSQRLRKHLLPRMPRPAAIITPSQYLADLARAAGQFADIPVHRVPYGVTMLDRPESREDRRQCKVAVGVAADVPVVLLIAANFQSPFKGMPLARETLGQLAAEVGGGPAVPLTVLILGANASELKLPANVTVRRLGFVRDPGMLARAYRAADVTMVPSIADNFPYVALESLACQTPVASFDVGGLTEIVGADQERGVLARRFDTAQLAGKVLGLLASPAARLDKGEAGRRWVERNCQMGQWIERHLELYSTVVRDFGRTSENARRANATAIGVRACVAGRGPEAGR